MPSRQENRRSLSASDKLALLRRHPLFGAIAPELLERLSSYATTRAVHRGDSIFAKGDPGNSLYAVCAGLRYTSVQVEDVLFLDLPGRLAKILLQLTETAKLSQARRVAITQREIGQMIGMSRESTNKQLRDWEDRNWVRLERGGVVVLEPDALAALARARSED